MKLVKMRSHWTRMGLTPVTGVSVRRGHGGEENVYLFQPAPPRPAGTCSASGQVAQAHCHDATSRRSRRGSFQRPEGEAHGTRGAFHPRPLDRARPVAWESRARSSVGGAHLEWGQHSQDPIVPASPPPRRQAHSLLDPFYG